MPHSKTEDNKNSLKFAPAKTDFCICPIEAIEVSQADKDRSGSPHLNTCQFFNLLCNFIFLIFGQVNEKTENFKTIVFCAK